MGGGGEERRGGGEGRRRGGKGGGEGRSSIEEEGERGESWCRSLMCQSQRDMKEQSVTEQ